MSLSSVPLQRGSGLSTARDGAAWFRPGELGLWSLAEFGESFGWAAALLCPQLRSWRSVLRYSLDFFFYLFPSVTYGFLTRPRVRWVGPFLCFVVQVWTSDGDGGCDVCSVTKQVGGTATVFVCLCACKCMCGTEACSTPFQTQLIEHLALFCTKCL